MNPRQAAADSKAEQAILALGFFLLFPGFFFYHTLLGTGAMGAILGGYFAPVSVLFMLPLALIYAARIRRDRRRLTGVDLHFGAWLAYFGAVVLANAAAGANRTIVTGHILGILFLSNIFILFACLDFNGPRFRKMGLLSLAAMTAIPVFYSVDGVFYLGALGIAKDADSLATYQGFSRSYLVTYLAVVAFTRALPLRLLLHALGAVALFLNTARSEFVALLFVIPIVEFYYSRHKMYFVLAAVLVVVAINLNLDQILAALPHNRIFELLDLSQSTSANKRHHLTVYALNTIAAHPLLGDYASYTPGYYSHNILSAWVDLGLFGFVYLAAILMLAVAPMFVREYFAGRRSSTFVLGFAMACATVLLLLTSHYFTDMLIGATLGACSKYLYERKYAKDRAPDFGPSASRYPDFHQAMPHPRGQRT